MRISDWSSDVCSSDLRRGSARAPPPPAWTCLPSCAPWRAAYRHGFPRPNALPSGPRAPARPPRRLPPFSVPACHLSPSPLPPPIQPPSVTSLRTLQLLQTHFSPPLTPQCTENSQYGTDRVI